MPSLIVNHWQSARSIKHWEFFRKSLSFYYQNVSSIKSKSKFSTLKDNLSLRATKIDVLVFIETWFSDDNTQDSIDGYTVYRNDENFEGSNKTIEGRVMIVVNKKKKTRRQYTSDTLVEHMFKKIIVGNTKLIIGVVYLQPFCSTDLLLR